MIFGHDRAELRRMYRDAWRKAEEDAPLSPLEAQIVAVIEAHPEYLPAMDSDRLDADYTPDAGKENPFLHMGLHLAVRDQVSIDRPPGIARVHADLTRRLGGAHAAEHCMIEALAETLWEAQRHNAAPDQEAYLERLERLR